MLGNRAISVQLTKQPKKDGSTDAVECTHRTPEEINKIIQDNATHFAKLAGTVYLTHRIVSTVCEIAIIAAKKKL